MATTAARSSTFDKARLRTVHVVPLTAMDAQGRLNLEVQARHTARLAKAGLKVYLPAAGTSEFHSLSADEIVALVKVTREAAGREAVIFAPVGGAIGQALDVGERSLAAGADGIMFMPFSHPYMCNPGAKDYYLTVIETLQCPTLVYKKSPIPSDALLLELAAHPQVVGVKYAENNLSDFRNVVLKDGGRIEWLCGSAERFAPYYILAGAPGYTTGAGNVAPHITLAMHAAFSAGAYAEGMRLQKLLLPIEDYRAREGDSYNISMLKHAMRVIGWDLGVARPPQRQVSPQDQAQIADLLQPIMAAESELQHEVERVGLAGR